MKSRGRIRGFEAISEEFAPILRRDLIQCGGEILEGVGRDNRFSILPSEEGAAEVVKRTLAVRELADGYVNFEPQQDALNVEVGSTAIGHPFRWRKIKHLGCERCVLKGSPVPSHAMLQCRSDSCEILPRLCCSPQAAACAQYGAQVGGQPLIHPDEVAVHGLLEIGCRQAYGSTKLPIPRV